MTERTWKLNAEEFRALDTGEGWPFAHLVACAVEKGAGQTVGLNRGTGPARSTNTGNGKVSAEEFARAAGCGSERVLNYLKAWDRECVKAGQPKAADLMPEDTWTLDLSGFPEWKKGTLGTKGKTQDILNNPTKVAEALSKPAFREKVRGLLPPAAVESLYHEIKLDRVQEDRSPAARKAASAAAHEAMAPIRRAVSTTQVSLAVEALREAKESVRDLIENDAMTSAAFARIDKEYTDLGVLLAEARFSQEATA